MHAIAYKIGRLPLILRCGVSLFALGAALDLLFHASPLAWQATLAFILGPAGYWAHAVTVLGMGVTVVGIIARRS